MSKPSHYDNDPQIIVEHRRDSDRMIELYHDDNICNQEGFVFMERNVDHDLNGEQIDDAWNAHYKGIGKHN